MLSSPQRVIVGWMTSEGWGRCQFTHSGADDRALGISQSCGFYFSHCSLTGLLNHLNNSQHFGLKNFAFVFTNFWNTCLPRKTGVLRSPMSLKSWNYLSDQSLWSKNQRDGGTGSCLSNWNNELKWSWVRKIWEFQNLLGELMCKGKDVFICWIRYFTCSLYCFLYY